MLEEIGACLLGETVCGGHFTRRLVQDTICQLSCSLTRGAGGCPGKCNDDMSSADTIYALSSATGRAGVAVIRVSGARAGEILAAVSRGPLPPARLAVLRSLQDPETHETIDRGLVLWFPAPHSFTGEDLCELHVHGGRAVIARLLQTLGAFTETRLAAAGEFARRAFDHEKIGLTEAEGLADIIDAETEAQRRQALRQARGLLEALYEGWRVLLLETLGLVEAAIDFSDEGDVADNAIRMADERAGRLLQAIEVHLADGRRGEIIHDGLQVLLAGVPNVGKSSLLNRLARREAAIVSPEPGTTRDVIQVALDLGGYRIVVSDTAGIRDAEGAVEREGVRRTLELGRRADLILWLTDTDETAVQVPAELAEGSAQVLQVRTKIDLSGRRGPVNGRVNGLAISAVSGEGLVELETQLISYAHALAGHDEGPVITQRRHREALEQAADGLRAYCTGEGQAIELRAEDLRLAANSLGRLVGRVDAEDVLGQIFARFCIGK